MNKTKKEYKYTLENFPKIRINFFFKVTSLTLTVTLLFAGFGYLLDYLLNTKPVFLLIFLIVSFPVIQYLLYRYVKKL
jgi:F0F1-type ATP synthase assembly protein I